MSEDNQTPEGAADEVNVTIIEDPDKQSPEGTAGETKETPEIDYKQKFAASTTEAQRLATENKLLQSEVEKGQGRYSTLETDKAEMEKKFADENPEVYDSIKTRKEIGELKEMVALQKEKGAISDYVSENPKAAAQKESLRRLGRAFPDKSYKELWDENFKELVGVESVEEKEAKKQSQPEKGDGSETEIVGGMTAEEFRKLPLEKRKAILIKQGGSF